MGAVSVLQQWVETLPLKQQVTLISAVRGPDDGCRVAKELARRLRQVVLVPAEKKPSFMSADLDQGLDLGVLEYKSQHYTQHVRKAARLLAEVHPEEPVRAHWQWVRDRLDNQL